MHTITAAHLSSRFKSLHIYMGVNPHRVPGLIFIDFFETDPIFTNALKNTSMAPESQTCCALFTV